MARFVLEDTWRLRTKSALKLCALQKHSGLRGRSILLVQSHVGKVSFDRFYATIFLSFNSSIFPLQPFEQKVILNNHLVLMVYRWTFETSFEIIIKHNFHISSCLTCNRRS